MFESRERTRAARTTAGEKGAGDAETFESLLVTFTLRGFRTVFRERIEPPSPMMDPCIIEIRGQIEF